MSDGKAIGRRSLGALGATIAAGIAGGPTTARAQPTPTPDVPILMDGHVHITNRVYWEGIDPWQPQPSG